MKMEKFTLRSQGVPFKEVGSSPAKDDETTTSSNIMAGFDMDATSTSDSVSRGSSIEVDQDAIEEANIEALKKSDEEFKEKEIKKETFEDADSKNIDTSLADQVYSKQKVDTDLVSKGLHTEGDLRGKVNTSTRDRDAGISNAMIDMNV